MNGIIYLIIQTTKNIDANMFQVFVRSKKIQGGVIAIREDLLSVTIYKNVCSVFNRFFNKNMLDRMSNQTELYAFDYNTLCLLLNAWAQSSNAKDNLYNLVLPMPNVKDFLWNTEVLNSAIRSRYILIYLP